MGKMSVADSLSAKWTLTMAIKKSGDRFESVGVWYLCQTGASVGFQFFNKKQNDHVQQKSQCAIDFLPSWMCMFI